MQQYADADDINCSSGSYLLREWLVIILLLSCSPGLVLRNANIFESAADK
jgi:hypothetical protein